MKRGRTYNYWLVAATITPATAFVVGLLLRWSYLQWLPYEYDFKLFLSYAERFQQLGPKALFGSDYTIQIPPIIPLLTVVWLKLKSIIPGASGLSEATYLKMLPAIVELILMGISARAVIGARTQLALVPRTLLLSMILLQPGLGFIGAGWCQMDSFVSLFMLLGCLNGSAHPKRSLVFMLLACFVKIQAAFGLLLYLLFFLLQRRYKDFLSLSFLCICLSAVFVLLLYSLGFKNLQRPFLISVGLYPVLSMYAANIWWYIYGGAAHEMSDMLGSMVSFRSIGISLFVLSLLPLVFFLRTPNMRSSGLCLAMGYMYFALFFFATEMHERYLFTSIVFLGIGALEQKWLLLPYATLSCTFFVSCYFFLKEVLSRSSLDYSLLLERCAQVNLLCMIFYIGFLVFYVLREKHGSEKLSF